jgi:hypothetical protein
MGKKFRPFFALGFQKAVLALRNGGLLWENQIPEMRGPVQLINESGKDEAKNLPRNNRFLVKVCVRPNFTPKELWLKFNKRGTSIAVSPDLKDWVNISLFARK